ncbi:hypothetical protein GCM10009721_13790 [Terrabacter tumescens]|uniref:Uncharacterized protein n=1 Tax=Terrabacter tumescens TaxID=60443 RepID=A0ABQ2HTV8_9MICO|nr:hypothetical protein GCM10009721_13790 [Terrabacter tumescens]
MPGSSSIPPSSGSHLDDLRTAVRAARSDVELLRSGKVDPALLLTARGVLLEALEIYAAELVRRRLPMPPALRDDLRLQRGIRAARGLR